MKFRSILRAAIAFVVAVLATAVAGSIVQTQFNLTAITMLGAEVPLALWAATTAEDVVRFGPVMAAIAGGAFLPAFAAAFLAVGRAPTMRVAIFAAAGLSGLATAFAVMGWFTPMPTLVAAARGPFGFAAMAATGLLGGIVFARESRPSAVTG